MIGDARTHAVDALVWASADPVPVALQSALVEVDVEGGHPIVVVAGIVTFLAATVLSVAVTYRFIEGYRRTASRPVLLLAVGMFLLAAAPMFVRLVTPNVEAIPFGARTLATSLSELSGLLVILYVVYTR
jgi:hypothetical protein